MNLVKPVGQVWGRGWHGRGLWPRLPQSVFRAVEMDRQWRGRAEQCRWVPAELRARHGLRLFSLEHSCCYEALLLDEERGRLFVGAKNHLLSLALDDISQRDRKVMRQGGTCWWGSAGCTKCCDHSLFHPQIYWPAPVEWREECNWAGKDITVSEWGMLWDARTVPGICPSTTSPFIPSIPRLSA